MKNKNTIRTVLCTGLFLFFAQEAAMYYNLYIKLWWYDIPMHILGGIWVALMFFYWFYERNEILKKENGFLNNIIFALGFVALFGTFWELYEYSFDTFFTDLHLQTLSDTLKDLVDDLMGGLLASIYYLLKK